MILRPPRTNRTNTRVPYTTLCRSERKVGLKPGSVLLGKSLQDRGGGTQRGALLGGQVAEPAGQPGVTAGAIDTQGVAPLVSQGDDDLATVRPIGRATCRERVCQSV